MAKYQDLLLNGLNKIINDLLTQTPSLPPGNHAREWLSSSGGPQNLDVNAYMQGKVDGKTATDTSFTPDNWATWSSRMKATFASASTSNAPPNVVAWLGTTYSMLAYDAPTVPDDVIAWTKANLPSVSVDVEVKPQAPSRVGS